MFDRLRQLFRRASPAPVAMTPLPITLNPTVSQALVRNLGRLVRLYYAIEHGDTRASLRAEIERRKAAIAVLGHVPPANEMEARALLNQLGGD